MKYQYTSIADILTLCAKESLPFWEVVLLAEMENSECSREEVIAEAKYRLGIFSDSVKSGLADIRKTGSGMSGGQAKILAEHKPLLMGSLMHKALTYAIAVNEANAKMYRVVACPTAGSCGVMPGCIEAVAEELDLDENARVRAFFAGAGIGKVITDTACVAGAVGGCQAEIGSASAMAAGAVVSMLEGTPEQVATAMSLALKNVLGLVCDPVAGLVEVPCVKRNGIYAVHAISAAEMAMAGLETQIPPDEVIMAMDRIGRAMPSSLRETSEGGLAVTPTAIRIADMVKNL